MVETIDVIELGRSSSWWRIETVGDHYAVVKSGMVIAVVERFNEQWLYVPLTPWGGEVFYSSTVAEALKYAVQKAENA